MADTVQYLMEKMLPELQDFRMRGYFNEEEIGKIVATRSDFEYKLKRRAPDRVTFVRYLEYEANLEKLRRRRRKKVGLPSGFRSKADSAYLRRVHSIYTRLLRRYPGDVDDWARYFAFCADNGAHKQLAKAHAKALEAHSRKADLWILAARFEIAVRHNMVLARALLQRGLRLNGHDLNLWIEYFKAELMYQQKLIDRRRLLGLPVRPVKGTAAEPAQLLGAVASALHDQMAESDGDSDDTAVGAAASGSDVDDDDGFDLTASDDEDEDEDEDEDDNAQPAAPAADDDDGDAEAINVNVSLLASAVPRTIFRMARNKFPASMELHLRCLDLYLRFDNTELGIDEVYESLAERFASAPDNEHFVAALNELARRPMRAYLAARARLSTAPFEPTAFQAAWLSMSARYEEMLEVAASPAFLEAYMETLLSLLETVAGHGALSAYTVAARALRLGAEAAAADMLTETLAARWAQLAARLPADVRPVGAPSAVDAAAAGTAAFPSSPVLAELHLQALAAAGMSASELVTAGLAALRPITTSHDTILSSNGPFNGEQAALRASVHRLWRTVLHVALWSKGKVAGRDDAIAASAGALPDGGAECIVFEWAVATGSSTKSIRKVYAGLLARSVMQSRALLGAIIRFEASLQRPSMETLDPLHAAITTSFGSPKASPDSAHLLWIDWLRSLLRTKATPARVTAVYNKATQALKSSETEMEAFLAAYHALNV
ncbi:U3 snoRNP protein [Thecamonas trahens ATCC 50062]|uniref:U3 snoRNP protein n=1 Tax=Thecamonas trahens ATCC 50062 TaxID=461836 RepID=A0A0L0DGC8_THETB|nr:U3 snoRNP protein [Thecamonas trahens ATCC 50062]KNC50398.1 U3 snoRNP protein [Thecamonas trahens ATCC 50062]|eukprot:XP_013756940.1 U3 snoRNP protein [Thecamonas trahens ATCC 50062]